MARVPYCTEDDLPEEYRDLFERTEKSRSSPVTNLVKALAYTPAVLDHRTAYSNSLRRDAKISRRDAELAILTVGHVTKSNYEFVHHIKAGIAQGISREQILALDDFEASELFDDRERAIIRYAREATLNVRVSQATWDAVARHLKRRLLVELVLIVAWYNQTIRVTEPLQLDLEDNYKDVTL